MVIVAFEKMNNLTTGLSSIKNVISTNLSANQIAVMTNGNTTAIAASVDGPLPIWAGFIGCLVASIFFGSSFVPVKQFSAGDGVFFQFIFCIAVYFVGLIVDLILNNQNWYPLVLIGGIRMFLFFKNLSVYPNISICS